MKKQTVKIQLDGLGEMTNALRYNSNEDRLLKERELSMRDRADISIKEYNEMKERIRYLSESEAMYRRAFHKFYDVMRKAGIPKDVIEAIYKKDCYRTVYHYNPEHLTHEVTLKFVVDDMELLKNETNPNFDLSPNGLRKF
jgi:hypothetical protein